MAESTIRPGHNCWQVAHADRVALLVDGHDYFSAFHAALQQAQHHVYILAWDIDSRMRLIREESDNHGLPVELGQFISHVLQQKDDLHVYILNWDWAMLYTMEREWLPLYKPVWSSHPRLHFKLDGLCPLVASHHQKVVVIDDQIAFSGGFDLGKHRWDTSSHLADDARRIDADKQSYPPFHDVQMLVEGDTAQALGELARSRWLAATGEQLTPPSVRESSPWPQHVTPDFEDVEVAIARTYPQNGQQTEIREVECLYLDSIQAAEKLIYIENQYFTSWKIADALADSLQQRNGPDVVLVLPLMTGGWLEQATMDVLRYRVVCKLEKADRHNRLRICYPHYEPLGDVYIRVHSKIMIVDDRLLRVGSANLSNRSMGLDTECDLVIEATDKQQRSAISRFRERLLGEHLALESDDLRQALSQKGSLTNLIDACQDKPRSLRILNCHVSELAEQMLPSSAVVDPERPMQSEQMAEIFLPIEQPRSVRKQWWTTLTILLAVLVMAGIWRWTPLSEWLTLQTLTQAAGAVKAHPLTPLLVLGAFSVAGLVAFPVTLLIVATALTFGAVWGSIYALTGSVLSALLGYGAGHVLGREKVQKLAGSRINRLSRRLAHHGVLAVITVRIIPVAPFTVINLVAGASHISLRDYFLGTLLGMLPAIIAISVFSDSLIAAVQKPEAGQLAILALILALIALVIVVMKKFIPNKPSDLTDS